MPITKTHTLVCSLAFATATFAGTAMADDMVTPVGPYLSLSGGLNAPTHMDMDLRDPVGSPAVPGAVHFDNGFAVNGAFGNKWNNGFRTELELGYREADVRRFSSTRLDGSQKILGAMANVLYDIDTGSNIGFSVGGGLGVGRNKWDNVENVSGSTLDFNDSATNFQWQAIGEVTMPISSRTVLFADYRYITLYDNKFNSAPPGSTISHGTDTSHNILLGVRFFLNNAM